MKSVFASKTLWINAIVIATTWLLNHKGIMADAGLDADTQVTILGIANFILRFVTTKGVTFGSTTT